MLQKQKLKFLENEEDNPSAPNIRESKESEPNNPDLK
jgi:hypothetical protein